MSEEPTTKTVMVTMTETVVYRRKYTLEEFADLVDCAVADVPEIVADEDGGYYDESYGILAHEDSDNDGLLDDIVKNPGELDVPERSWSFEVGH